MRRIGLVALLFAMGCASSVGVGYGTDHDAPELVARFAQDVDGPHWATVARIGFRDGCDSTVFTVETAPNVFADVATADADVSHDSVSVGGEVIFPAGRWAAVLAVTLGVAKFDVPAFNTDALSALSAAQITGITCSRDEIAVTFNVRAQSRWTIGRCDVSLYAELGSNDSDGRMIYTYTPLGVVSEAESWETATARYGVTVAYRF